MIWCFRPISSWKRQIDAGIYQKLDHAKLSNYGGQDPKMLELMAPHDPDNAYSVAHHWGTTSMGYNVDMINERMENAPVDSWDLILDPDVVKNFADCGVFVVDAPAEIVATTMNYLGFPPGSEEPEHLEAVEEHLAKIRPHLKYFSGSQHMNDLASGDACLGIMYNADLYSAQIGADEGGSGIKLQYVIPKEGALMWVDSMLIPADAGNVDNAHKFIDWVLKPEVGGAISSWVPIANSNVPSLEFVEADIRANEGIFPTPEQMERLFTMHAHTQKFDRKLTRAWTAIKTGR